LLLMLEDNSDRIRRFSAALKRLDPALPLKVWRDAWVMIRELETWLPEARLLSLDHDLDPAPAGASDPGTGLDFARHLGALPPRCPVIIHTSNSDRANWMAGLLELGGWSFHRVAPIGDDWIETDWSDEVGRLLKQSSSSHSR
jgi:hypothetical protein